MLILPIRLPPVAKPGAVCSRCGRAKPPVDGIKRHLCRDCCRTLAVRCGAAYEAMTAVRVGRKRGAE